MEKTKKIFLERINYFGYTQKTFSEYVGRSEDSIKHWNDNTIPTWAWVLIELMEEKNDYKEFFDSYRKINQIINKYTS